MEGERQAEARVVRRKKGILEDQTVDQIAGQIVDQIEDQTAEADGVIGVVIGVVVRSVVAIGGKEEEAGGWLVVEMLRVGQKEHQKQGRKAIKKANQNDR